MPRINGNPTKRECKFTSTEFDVSTPERARQFKKHCLKVRKHNRVWNYCAFADAFYEKNWLNLIRSCATTKELTSLMVDDRLVLAQYWRSCMVVGPTKRSKFFNDLLKRQHHWHAISLNTFPKITWSRRFYQSHEKFNDARQWTVEVLLHGDPTGELDILVPPTESDLYGTLAPRNSRYMVLDSRVRIPFEHIHPKIMDAVAYGIILGNPSYDIRDYDERK